MNKILVEISNIITDGLKTYLPNVNTNELEENGKIYYMNGRDGTKFDWFVNDHLCPFMCFYDDKENLGAVKAMLHKDGTLECYYYENHEQKPTKEITRHINVSEDELVELLTQLYNAECTDLYDAAIELYNTDEPVTDEEIIDFKASEADFSELLDMKNLYSLYCLASKKITEEGYKAGFIVRDEPVSENDSGWFLSAGDEDDDYIKQNVHKLTIGQLLYLEPDLEKYLTAPVGSCFIRGENGELEPDHGQEEVNVMKREN